MRSSAPVSVVNHGVDGDGLHLRGAVGTRRARGAGLALVARVLLDELRRRRVVDLGYLDVDPNVGKREGARDHAAGSAGLLAQAQCGVIADGADFARVVCHDDLDLEIAEALDAFQSGRGGACGRGACEFDGQVARADVPGERELAGDDAVRRLAVAGYGVRDIDLHAGVDVGDERFVRRCVGSVGFVRVSHGDQVVRNGLGLRLRARRPGIRLALVLEALDELLVGVACDHLLDLRVDVRGVNFGKRDACGRDLDARDGGDGRGLLLAAELGRDGEFGR